MELGQLQNPPCPTCWALRTRPDIPKVSGTHCARLRGCSKAHKCLRELSTFISLDLAPSKTFEDPKGVLRSGCRVRGVLHLQSGKYLQKLGSINHGQWVCPLPCVKPPGLTLVSPPRGFRDCQIQQKRVRRCGSQTHLPGCAGKQRGHNQEPRHW